jgi:hypothetical protein
MEKSTRIVAQVYGYAICLVAVITFLISITALVTAIIDLGDPMHSGYTPQGSPSLASLENYKLDVMRSFQKGTETNAQSYVPTEQTLKSMYEAARNDKIQSSKHQSNKAILISSLIIAISMILFFAHCNWLRRMTKAAQ